MNILIINHYAGSIYHGMEYRPYYMAREWVKMGHKVTIVAADESHLRGKRVEIPEGKFSFLENIDGIDYFWLKTIAYNGNGVKRAFNMVSFIFQLLRFGKKIKNNFKPDIVISSSTYPAEIFGAHYIAKISDAKLIYEIHDLWPLSPMELGHMSKWHPFIFGMQIAENYCYKHCDAVVSMLPKVSEHVTKHGLSIEKLHIVPNGICTNEWNYEVKISNELQQKIDCEKQKGNFIVVYAGQHGIANALYNFILAAEILKNKKLTLFLIGKGPEKENLKNLVKQKNLSNVIFIDHVSKASIPNLLDCFDCLYIGLQKQPLFRFGVSPNKLMDYMMSGKPIIQAIEAGNDIVKEAGCGFSVPAENPEALAEAIRKMINTSEEDRKAMGERGREYVMKHHDYKVLAKKFLTVMDGLLEKN